MGKQRNGVMAGGEGKGSRVDFFRAREITLYLYANENDPVREGGNWQRNIYTKLCFALDAQSMVVFVFSFVLSPIFQII